MVQMTVKDALEKWGEDLVIAATGAIAEKGKEGEVRMIYDGSNGITTNPGMRVRDQVRYPIAQDGMAVLSECAEDGALTSASTSTTQVPIVRWLWRSRSGVERPVRSGGQRRRLRCSSADNRLSPIGRYGLRRE